MFVSGSQFYVFVACLAFGSVCGIFFSLSELFKIPIKNVILRIIPDFICFIITAVLFVGYSYLLKFPNFRAYMIIGVLVGILVYFKSFHILLAKCLKIIYNKYRKILHKRKKSGYNIKNQRINQE